MDPQDNDRVASLLGGLKRVDAPANFESRVRSRIAEGEQPKSSLLPAFLKLAIPTGGLAAIALALYFAGIFSRGVGEMQAEDVTAPVQHRTEEKASVDQSPASNSNLPLPQQQDLPSNGELAQGDANVNRSLFRKNQKLSNSNGASTDSQKSPMSQDQGLTPAPPDKLPPGFQTIPKAADPKTAPVRPGVPATEFLRYLGVVSEARGNALYVTSVVQNSPAERWGVKAGDTIEALNSNNVNASSVYPSGVDLREIRVRRNGASLSFRVGR